MRENREERGQRKTHGEKERASWRMRERRAGGAGGGGRGLGPVGRDRMLP